MTNTVDLDAIRAEARKKYQPVVIALGDDVTAELKPVLRMPKKDREAVLAAIREISDLDDLNEDDEDDDELIDEYANEACSIIARALRLICTSPRRLLSELDKEEDPRIRAELYTTVLQVWARETQLGEAASSPA
ncbi:phage tail assembly protein [Mycolicibacterium aichiense]|uniref:Tail assembly chaperone n=1 Tax=Mycolicibacterium aichiense TaxID=1799 RepID=A0AAD1MES6_9MYCO|nr:phage tail assembly protein [Mycolicibacterium aichiense]QFG07991.1 tail assembly chaperone [Mycobacterium phage Herbertwm]BBX09499.1 hypothetical protein MAIC_43020 [Mycolicibacterium aichiense]SUA14064.1 Uncharacterised protein [Mycolicibacterium aichiense]